MDKHFIDTLQASNLPSKIDFKSLRVELSQNNIKEAYSVKFKKSIFDKNYKKLFLNK